MAQVGAGSQTASERLIREQIDYYRSRAPEYDDWFFRRHRYDRGLDWNRTWFAQVAEVRDALRTFAPSGRVLELACGTGLWTAELADSGAAVTALDSAAETLAINRARVARSNVRYVRADIFQWQSRAGFDCTFFGFWLSHVPPDRFEAFWSRLRTHLRPGGRFFFVDSANDPNALPIDAARREGWRHRRRLGDGREFDIVKIYYDPRDLEARLERLGWQCEIHKTADHFVYGSGRAP